MYIVVLAIIISLIAYVSVKKGTEWQDTIGGGMGGKDYWEEMGLNHEEKEDKK